MSDIVSQRLCRLYLLNLPVEILRAILLRVVTHPRVRTKEFCSLKTVCKLFASILKDLVIYRPLWMGTAKLKKCRYLCMNLLHQMDFYRQYSQYLDPIDFSRLSYLPSLRSPLIVVDISMKLEPVAIDWLFGLLATLLTLKHLYLHTDTLLSETPTLQGNLTSLSLRKFRSRLSLERVAPKLLSSQQLRVLLLTSIGVGGTLPHLTTLPLQQFQIFGHQNFDIDSLPTLYTTPNSLQMLSAVDTVLQDQLPAQLPAKGRTLARLSYAISCCTSSLVVLEIPHWYIDVALLGILSNCPSLSYLHAFDFDANVSTWILENKLALSLQFLVVPYGTPDLLSSLIVNGVLPMLKGLECDRMSDAAWRELAELHEFEIGTTQSRERIVCWKSQVFTPLVEPPCRVFGASQRR
ncbi:hypothetical protein BT69DRAFT_1278361, partial [Atractiella rhizophila]